MNICIKHCVLVTICYNNGMEKDSATYIAIIGDIRQSKTLPDRAGVQKRLRQSLEEVNKKYSEHIASRFVITLGDEFQGVLTHVDPLFNILEHLELDLTGHASLRFGIGIGKIVTAIDRDAAIGADGPAYYRARDMIDMIKKEETSNKGITLHMMISLDADPVVSDMITAYLGMLSWIKESWTDRQRIAVYTMSLEGEHQVIAARKLGIHQSSLQRRVAAAGYYTYAAAKRSLTAFLMKKGAPYA